MSATGSSEPARADWFREVLKYKGIRPCIPGPEVAWQGRLLRKAPLRTPQPDQAHVRRAEGLAPHRDPLRPMRQDLPLRRRTRRYRPLLTLKVKASGPWNSSASTRRGTGPRDPARDGLSSPPGGFPGLARSPSESSSARPRAQEAAARLEAARAGRVHGADAAHSSSSVSSSRRMSGSP